MKIRAIDHVTLYVHSIDKVKNHYCDLLDLACQDIDRDGIRTLVLENERVHFFVTENPNLDPKFIAQQHLSFAVAKLDDVIKILKANGIPYQVGRFQGFKHHNYDWCEWVDPEGIRLECVQHL